MNRVLYTPRNNIYSCGALVFRSLNDNVSIVWLLSSLCKNHVLRVPFSECLYHIQMHCYLELSLQQDKRCQEFTGSSHLDLDSRICLGWNLQNDPLFNLIDVFGHSPFISPNRDIVHTLLWPILCPAWCCLSSISSVRSVAWETPSRAWFCLNVL